MKNLATALVKAQKQFQPALKDSNNPFYKSKYADLGNCLDAVMTALNDNGIALIQPCHESETGITVETVFVHESGEMLSCGKLHVPAIKQDPQQYGSALTYARRYSLMAACGIAPEDDDGNATVKTITKEPIKQSPAPNLKPPPLNEAELVSCIAAMQEATDLEVLKGLYTGAYNRAADDVTKLILTKNKDALKLKLEGAK